MKEFFEAFNIKPNIRCVNDSDSYYYDCEIKINNNGCIKCEKYKAKCEYPFVTSDIILGLIGILTKKHCNITLYWGLPKLTEQILKQCIKDAKDEGLQAKVRALFNEL